MNETEKLAQQLMLQAYALPETKLRELLDALEVELVNRLAEQAGYISSEESCFV